MVCDIHNKAVTPNSPSKIRGGAAQAAGALKTPAKPAGALTPPAKLAWALKAPAKPAGALKTPAKPAGALRPTTTADTTSPGVTSRGALVSPPPPALRATSPQAGEGFSSSCSKEGVINL